MIIVTNQRNQYLFQIPEMKERSNFDNKDSQLTISLFSSKFPQSVSNYSERSSPYLVGQELKYIVAGDESGVVTIWKDALQLENNCGTLLRGHASKISSIKVAKNQDFIFTLGHQDNSIFEWSIELITNPPKESLTHKKDAGSIPPEHKCPEQIRREQDFCVDFDPIESRSRDSFALVRGYSNKLINSMYSNTTANPDENELVNKRIPEKSIKLHRVYGFEAFDRRNTIAYIDMSEDSEPDPVEGLLPYEHISRGAQRSLNSSSEPLLTYVYFVSRVAVVSTKNSKSQRFYEGHSNKVSCMAIHPNKKTVATGECAKSPQIHVWRANSPNCAPAAIIQTFHGVGIINMAFSRCGHLIVSVGIDNFFSLQVTNWKQEEVVAFRNTSPSRIIDVVVNPYDKYEFATCGLHIVQVWKVQGKSILLKQNVNINLGDKNNLVYVTCLRYVYYYLKDEIKQDIVLGTSQGDLGIISNGNYIKSPTKEPAHQAMVNCIKVTDIFDVLPAHPGPGHHLRRRRQHHQVLRLLLHAHQAHQPQRKRPAEPHSLLARKDRLQRGTSGSPSNTPCRV